MTVRSFSPAVLLTAALLAGGSPQAGAQAPAPCGTAPIRDARGDQEVGLVLDPTHAIPRDQGPDNLDITHAFFDTRRGIGGVWRTSVNIGIANLTRAVPPESATGVVSWALRFSLDDTLFHLKAQSDGQTVTYRLATGWADDTPDYPAALTWMTWPASGRFIEGPDGLVSIDLPAEASAPGTVLEDAFVVVSPRNTRESSLPGAETGYRYDAAPDEEVRAGLDLTLEACPEPAAEPAPSRPAPVAGPPPPSALPVRVRGTLGSARRATKRRLLAVKLTASQPVSRLSAQLRDRSGNPVASGRLRNLRGTRTIELRTTRRLTRGRYVLTLEGLVHGRRQSVEYPVTLRR